jgi:hypothetical protein
LGRETRGAAGLYWSSDANASEVFITGHKAFGALVNGSNVSNFRLAGGATPKDLFNSNVDDVIAHNAVALRFAHTAAKSDAAWGYDASAFERSRRSRFDSGFLWTEVPEGTFGLTIAQDEPKTADLSNQPLDRRLKQL